VRAQVLIAATSATITAYLIVLELIALIIFHEEIQKEEEKARK
jgi:hypothetical protein